MSRLIIEKRINGSDIIDTDEYNKKDIKGIEIEDNVFKLKIEDYKMVYKSMNDVGFINDVIKKILNKRVNTKITLIYSSGYSSKFIGFAMV